MGKEYKQLAVEDRSIIAVGLEQGLSRRAIGRLLKRPVSTVSREINRNAGADSYVPQEAGDRCAGRKFRRAKKLTEGVPGIATGVEDRLVGVPDAVAEKVAAQIVPY